MYVYLCTTIHPIYINYWGNFGRQPFFRDSMSKTMVFIQSLISRAASSAEFFSPAATCHLNVIVSSRSLFTRNLPVGDSMLNFVHTQPDSLA